MSVLTFIVMYAGLGACFAPGFVAWGAGRVDATAARATWGVRLLWAPGAAMLWPVLAWMWMRGVRR